MKRREWVTGREWGEGKGRKNRGKMRRGEI